MRASPKDLQLRPVCVAPAKDHVLRTHRRLKRIVGGMWSIGVYDGVELVGVAVVGRPNARKDDKPGRLQVLRVAVEEGNYNACSMLYGACARAAKAMGALDLWTFIHDDEPGTSLKAAGWIWGDERGRMVPPVQGSPGDGRAWTQGEMVGAVVRGASSKRRIIRRATKKAEV